MKCTSQRFKHTLGSLQSNRITSLRVLRQHRNLEGLAAYDNPVDKSQCPRGSDVPGVLDEACSAAERLLGELGLSGIELLGPVPAPMERRAGRYRAQLLLQATSRAPLHRLLSSWLLALEQMPSGRQVRWSLDVDPVDLY